MELEGGEGGEWGGGGGGGRRAGERMRWLETQKNNLYMTQPTASQTKWKTYHLWRHEHSHWLNVNHSCQVKLHYTSSG